MEENDKVTTKKPKNPGRVEWGRKLGKLSKQRKAVNPPEEIENNSKCHYYVFGILTVGSIIALYAYKKKPKTQTIEPKTEKPSDRQFANF